MPHYGEVFNVPPVALPYHIAGQTSFRVCAVVAVGVVPVDRVNHMIFCSNMLATQVNTLLHDYGDTGVIFLLLFHLGILGVHGIIVPFPSFLLVPSGGLSDPSS